MRVVLRKDPGRNLGLHFEGENPELYENIKDFIRHNTQWLTAPYSAAVKAAAPFIQCDTAHYLFIEFWSDVDRIIPVVEILQREFNLDIEMV